MFEITERTWMILGTGGFLLALVVAVQLFVKDDHPDRDRSDHSHTCL